MVAVISLSLVGLFSMIAGLFNVKKNVILSVAVLAILASVFHSVVYLWNTDATIFFSMLNFDKFGVAFTVAILVATLLCLFLSEHFFAGIPVYKSEHIALILFSVVGMVCMVSFENLSMLFLGIEIMSVPLYVLAGSEQKKLSSNEAALKYFLMGAFATGFLLMGIALVYGEVGSFDIYAIQQYTDSNELMSSPLLMVGVLFLIIALGFKVSVAPFHFWTPDVYQGSPTFVTMFMSSVVKLAGFGAFYRLFDNCFELADEFWQIIFTVIAAVTIVIGSLTALKQTNVKRLLAYSSVSHAGYMAIALMFMGFINDGAILYYALVYALSSVGIFAIVISVEKVKSDLSLDSFNGLAKTHPVMAFASAIFLISLAGLPPTAGFLAKFFILSAAVKNNFIWLAILAVLNAAIGVVYYLKLIIAIYFKPTDGSLAPVQNSLLYQGVLVFIAIVLLLLGILPSFVYNLI